MSESPAWYPTKRLVARYEVVAPRLLTLANTLSGQSKRRPEQPAEAGTLTLTRSVLADALRVTSRLGGPRLLPIHEPVSLGQLATRLELAGVALGAFRYRFRAWDNRHSAHFWRCSDGNIWD